MNDEQAAYELANANALNHFRSFVAVAVGAIDGKQLTRETAIAALIAAASVVASELPDGAAVMRAKLDDIARQMEAAGPRRPDA